MGRDLAVNLTSSDCSELAKVVSFPLSFIQSYYRQSILFIYIQHCELRGLHRHLSPSSFERAIIDRFDHPQ